MVVVLHQRHKKTIGDFNHHPTYSTTKPTHIPLYETPLWLCTLPTQALNASLLLQTLFFEQLCCCCKYVSLLTFFIISATIAAKILCPAFGLRGSGLCVCALRVCLVFFAAVCLSVVKAAWMNYYLRKQNLFFLIQQIPPSPF